MCSRVHSLGGYLDFFRFLFGRHQITLLPRCLEFRIQHRLLQRDEPMLGHSLSSFGTAKNQCCGQSNGAKESFQVSTRGIITKVSVQYLQRVRLA
jgi:hypothetical protein